ncbi:MAG: DotA/TraY family protein [Alphaproteobacteria bacterium]|nr:DotA/TraY family protein [Alphaproteobacteria bacterium]
MIANVRRADILKYVLLPQIRPRMRVLLGQGFALIPYLIALVYQCVRLLPPDHPYSNPANIGRFGIRNVIAEAANHLVLKVTNIDQIVLFTAVMVGVVLTGIQMFLIGLALFIQPAMAALPTSFSGFFITPESSQAQDLANIMLDLVFGVEGIFNSCISNAAASCTDIEGVALTPEVGVAGGDTIFNSTASGWPYPIHYALHELFRIYSLALLVVAVIITLYFMFTVVAETAQTGTPFGKRFNKVWAPIRIVMAFGLLVPFSSGLNSAQYIVLYAAKFGTGFATNGWVIFNETLGERHLGETKKLVATPQIPEAGALVQFMFVARTCYEADMIVNKNRRTGDNEIRMYAVKDPLAMPNNNLPIEAGTDYNDLMNFVNGDNIVTFRFGLHNKKDYAIYKGHVSPVCGEIAMMISDSRLEGGTGKQPEQGTLTLQKAYFDAVKNLWYTDFGTGRGSKPYNYACLNIAECLDHKISLTKLKKDEMMSKQDNVKSKISTALNEAVRLQEESGRWAMGPDDPLRQKGWAGAAIWYNRIAEMNGALTSATFKVPMPTQYPEVMEFVKKKKMQYDQNIGPQEMYKPSLANGDPVEHPDTKNNEVIKALYDAYSSWQTDGVATSTHTAVTGNIVIDGINALFGTDGLYNMRSPANQNVHPLAQLTALGKSLVDSAVNNIGWAAMGSVSGGLVSAFPAFAFMSSFAQFGANLLISFAMVGLTAGFILYYIVPFLPFIYFFFAFGGWIKAIFEAMVGTPLWALAHIRIDGDGLPGRAAIGGYFLILEIFLRPILTIFGFIASITIFAALVETLNDIYGVVTSNVGGHQVTASAAAAATPTPTPSDIEYYRGPVDEFFYTIVYAVIVYMLAMSSFKLIDQIPNGILRWMGQSVSPFGREEDAAEGLLQNSQMGLTQGLQKLEGGLGKMTEALSGLGRNLT